MGLVDANIVLRYLLDDHAELSPKAAEILERHSVTLPVEVGCEAMLPTYQNLVILHFCKRVINVVFG